MKSLGCAFGVAFVLVSVPAFAQEAGGEAGGEAAKPAAAPKEEPKAEGGGHTEFGQQGVIAVEAATGLDFSTTSHKAPEGSNPESTTKIRLEPSFHYFVAENISIGALLDFNYMKQGDLKTQEIGFGPIVGYNLPLAEKLSLWPQVGAQYVLESLTLTATPPATGSTSASGNKLDLVVNVPLLIHLGTHFHFGIGPYLRMDLTHKVESKDEVKDTTIGLMGAIGGWL